MTESKRLDELNPEEFKKLKIEFAPGCFDNFEGTQEELDSLINQIKEMFASGEAQMMARPVDFDDIDDDDLEIIEHLVEQDEISKGRKLQ